MKAKVYTLTGATENPVIAIDILLSNYFKSLKSMSTIVPSEVRSFIYDVQSSRGSSGMETAITNSLNFLFDPHFEDYVIEVTITDSGASYDITIGVAVKDNGSTIDVTKLINATDTRIVKLTDISNKGTR